MGRSMSTGRSERAEQRPNHPPREQRREAGEGKCARREESDLREPKGVARARNSATTVDDDADEQGEAQVGCVGARGTRGECLTARWDTPGRGPIRKARERG